MTEPDPLHDVYATMDAMDAAFAAGDMSAWTAADHPSWHSFQGDHFTSGAEMGEATHAQAAMSDEWKTIWRDGVVEGDAACEWGEVDWSFRVDGDRQVARLAPTTWRDPVEVCVLSSGTTRDPPQRVAEASYSEGMRAAKSMLPVKSPPLKPPSVNTLVAVM